VLTIIIIRRHGWYAQGFDKMDSGASFREGCSLQVRDIIKVQGLGAALFLGSPWTTHDLLDDAPSKDGLRPWPNQDSSL